MIGFHRFLIATAILFCLVLAVWMLGAFREDGGLIVLSLGIGFAAAAVALTYYLKNLDRFLHR